MLDFYEHYKDKPGYWLVKYEDALADQRYFVRTACEHYSLDPDRYDYTNIETLPVFGSSTVTNKEGNVTWDEHMQRPQDFKTVGKWQSWSSKQKTTFKRIAGQTLIDTGYCDDLNW